MAIVTLFDSCGVRITETQWREVPYQEGEIRVYSKHGERLEFSLSYFNLVERKKVMADALNHAHFALTIGV